MRKLIVGAVTVALLALVLAVTPAHAGVRVEHRAHAVFVLPERDGAHPAVFISALRMSGPYLASRGSANIGFSFQRGRCLAPDDLDTCVITDRDRWLGGNFRAGDVFEFDDDLGHAYLRVRRNGVTHEVTWTASEAAAPTASSPTCGPVAVGVAAGFLRHAEASGTVFGRSLRGATVLTASLSTVAYSC